VEKKAIIFKLAPIWEYAKHLHIKQKNVANVVEDMTKKYTDTIVGEETIMEKKRDWIYVLTVIFNVDI
jgi:hypothetical protein